MRVIYVCGYGRSGSTSLGLALSVQHSAMCVGEVSNISTATFLDEASCSCGRSYPTCRYWAAVNEKLAATPASTSVLSHRQRRLAEGILGLALPRFVLRRLASTAAFSERYSHVSFARGLWVMAEVADEALVDISKTTRLTANRPRFINAAGLDLELHLASRPLSGVVASYRAAHARRGRRIGWPASAVKVSIGRAAAAAAARWCARRIGAKLVRTTLAETSTIAALNPGTEPTNHMLAGNRGGRLHPSAEISV